MRVAVIGLGKLGAPLAAVLASKGHEVIGVDLSAETVAAINAGRAPVTEPGLQERIEMAGPRLRATTNLAEAIRETEVSFVLVPTPSGPDSMFINDYVLAAVRDIGAALRDSTHYHVVNITSTVMPGATGGVIRAALEQASGRTVGAELGLTYSPEFIALGSVVRDLLFPDMLLLGESDQRAGDMMQAVYSTSVESGAPVMRMNWVNAELTKISVNTYVTTKISYANMLAEMCESLPDADVAVVTRALGMDSRIGGKYLKGALGYGGPCFPRDNVAFAALARQLGTTADIAVATDRINNRQVERVVGLARKLAGSGKAVAVLGLSYKPHTPVVEESQGVMIARQLAQAGLKVAVFDPLARIAGDGITQAETPASALAGASLAIVTTPDPAFAALRGRDFTANNIGTVIDCWRILHETVLEEIDVVRLGQGKADAATRQPIFERV